MNTKSLIRNTLNALRLDLTKNLQYDRLTRLIMERTISKNFNCIDIGCHKGEILESMLKLAPDGQHFAFEPIPQFFRFLSAKFADKVSVFPYALSDHNGRSSFQYVKNAPAYSGLMTRTYDVDNPVVEEIKVTVKTLDSVIPENVKIDFIKIDVEGGEFDVLKGSERILREYRPVVIFESGLGASDFYGTDPGELFDFITKNTGMKISTLKGYSKQNTTMTRGGFEECFNNNNEWYFVAHP